MRCRKIAKRPVTEWRGKVYGWAYLKIWENGIPISTDKHGGPGFFFSSVWKAALTVSINGTTYHDDINKRTWENKRLELWEKSESIILKLQEKSIIQPIIWGVARRPFYGLL
jgi:hypothetical protein